MKTDLETRVRLDAKYVELVDSGEVFDPGENYGTMEPPGSALLLEKT